MVRYTIANDLEECRQLWKEAYAPALITDLWETRACFHRFYRRPLCFIAARDDRGLCGLLPLSWIEEAGSFGFFPGETFQGLTWLEQNRIHARDPEVFEGLLAHCPGPLHLRYLQAMEFDARPDHSVDEMNYRFTPSDFDYDMDRYFLEFSGKTLKRLKRELAALEMRDLSYRYDHATDFSVMIRLNRERFGESSYFHDQRFSRSCLELMRVLAVRGWLRMTTILDGETPIATDMGCLYRGVYTLLAGGTHGAYPGIAKLINLHHMARACQGKYTDVDFLCGSFSWKTLFHLKASPLYLLASGVPLTKPVTLQSTAPTPASARHPRRYSHVH